MTINLIPLFFSNGGTKREKRGPTKEVPKSKEAQKPTARADLTPLPMRIEMELGRMRGTWSRTETVEVTENGKPLPPRERKVTYVISDDKLIRLGHDGLIDETLSLKLDPLQSPKAIDMISLQYGTLWGIYHEWDGISSTSFTHRPTFVDRSWGRGF
jgi:uncharacterized protein (TIGR03067 family)